MNIEEASELCCYIYPKLKTLGIDRSDTAAAVEALGGGIFGEKRVEAYLFFHGEKPTIVYSWFCEYYNDDTDCHDGSDVEIGTVSGLIKLVEISQSRIWDPYSGVTLKPEFYLRRTTFISGNAKCDYARLNGDKLPERMDGGSKIPKRYHQQLTSYGEKMTKRWR